MGLLMVFGLLGAFAIRRLHFPAVTGYLIVGMIVGPSATALLSEDTTADIAHVLTPFGLSVFAFLIGGSLPVSTIRGLTCRILLIVLCEGALTWLFILLLITFGAPYVTDSDVLAFNDYLAMGIIIGAISLATAPAVTLALIEETRSGGSFTATLLGVVALDDALSIVALTIAISVGVGLVGQDAGTNAWWAVLEDLGRIALSIGLGAATALLLVLLVRFPHNRGEMLAISLGLIALAAGLAEELGLFPIIASMVMGFIMANRSETSRELVGFVRTIEDVIFVLFFTIAGAHLDLGIIREAGLLAALIVLGRCSGKYLGVSVGAGIASAPSAVRKYMGLALLPKAGVTVGLALLVAEVPQLESISSLVVSAVLASILFNSLLTPPLAKLALARSGEAGQSRAAH